MKYTLLTLITLLLINPLSAESDTNNRFLDILYDKTLQYAEAGESAIGKTIDVTMAEEFIKWRIVSHIWDSVPVIILFIALVFIFVWRFRIGSKDSWYSEANCIMAAISGILLLPSAILLMSASNNLKMAFQAYYAPKIYILDALAQYAQQITQ